MEGGAVGHNIEKEQPEDHPNQYGSAVSEEKI